MTTTPDPAAGGHLTAAVAGDGRPAPAGGHRVPRRAGFLAAVAIALACVLLAPPTPSTARYADAGTFAVDVGSVAAVPLRLDGGLDAGATHSIGWTAAGELYAWGGNAEGQLGTGDTAGRLRPHRVVLPEGVAVLDARAGVDLTIALTADGEVYTWGRTDVADNTQQPRRVPAFSAADDPVVAVDAGEGFSLALTAGGALYSWGLDDGRLGRDGTHPPATPARVTAQGLDGRVVTAVSAGREHGAAVVDGEVVLWGRSADHGGAGGVTVTDEAGDPLGGAAVEVAAGRVRTSIRTDEAAPARNVYGVDQSAGWRVGTLPAEMVGIAASTPGAGIQSSFWAWDAAGGLYAWGGNESHQLGRGPATTWTGAPAAVEDVGDPSLRIAPGGSHTLLGSPDGRVKGSGDNAHGQLGDGTTDPRVSFTDIVELIRWP